MLIQLKKRNFKIDLESVKRNQTEIPELRTTLSKNFLKWSEGINSQLVTTAERSGELKHRFNRNQPSWSTEKKRLKVFSVLCPLCYPSPDPVFWIGLAGFSQCVCCKYPGNVGEERPSATKWLMLFLLDHGFNWMDRPFGTAGRGFKNGLTGQMFGSILHSHSFN